MLFLNDPGIQGEPFLYASARHHLEQGHDVVHVVTDQPPSSVLRSLRATGLDLDTHRDQLHILDAYTPLLGLRQEGAWAIPDPLDPQAWHDALHELSLRHPDAVLLIDNLSTLADQIGMDRFLETYPILESAFARYRFSAALFTRWPYAHDLQGLQGAFDAVVRLHAIQERVVTGRYFSVDAANWVEGLDHRPRLYKEMAHEGVVVYIPKLVVTGPFNAGKSTFVRSVSESTVSVDRMGTTVVLDHGTVTLDGLKAEVFGTPGQSRFDPILKVIAGQALGVVVLVDATRPDSFARAQAMMEQVWRQGLPVIIAANKQDQPGALTPSEVARRLALPPHVQVVGCMADQPDSAKAVITRLIDAIMQPSTRDAPVGAAVVGGGA